MTYFSRVYSTVTEDGGSGGGGTGSGGGGTGSGGGGTARERGREIDCFLMYSSHATWLYIVCIALPVEWNSGMCERGDGERREALAGRLEERGVW